MRILFVFAVLFVFMVSCSKEEVVTPPPPPDIDLNMLPTEFRALFNIFDGQGVGAAVNLNDDIMLFFSKDGAEYAWFEDEEIKRSGRLDEQGGLFEGLAFAGVGGATAWNDDQIAIFNTVGGTYQWLRLDPDLVKGNSTNNTQFMFEDQTFSLWEWGTDNSCPFDKVGALMGFSKVPRGCTEVGDDDDFLWMVNLEGDKLTRYVKERGDFDAIVELEQWRSESVCGGSPVVFPINTIGAVCVYEPDGQDYKELFFTREGTEMVVLNGTRGTASEVYSLK